VLALLGSRVPATLKVFVAALAIVDDILCVLVISLFYTSDVSFVGLAIAAAGLGVSCLANWAGIRAPAVYAVISGFVWLAVLSSGVHATIAGVLMAFTIPARTMIDGPEFVARSRALLDRFVQADADSHQANDAVHDLERQCEQVQSPLHRIEHMLHPWVGFFIMPLFALANAGVIIPQSLAAALTHPVTLGVAVGLFVGKPLGITTIAWLAAKLKIASPPSGVAWSQIFGAAWLCGIGFTMSLFVAGLAFEEPAFLDMSKIAILGASVLAGTAGAIVLTRVSTPSAEA
jgi:Na+:H+ antiporter, NhaA family